MISLDKVRKLALALPGTNEEPHFEKISFRVNKKIFATVDQENKKIVLKFDLNDQDFFSLASKGSVYPIENKWGQQGWTCVEMKSTDLALFEDMLVVSYCGVAPKRLVEAVRQNLKPRKKTLN
ncbi:MmcQ/YjbR family DNA-binding protein [Leptospira sp. WS58.C1]|uniref:MmcQ/YjbR family DNA-binding protein n=1 Tax=Leptospira TaxID=171 RepID=UPI0002BF9C12|nr:MULTISPECIES: MmcQ/YjbR family DNA-binding protein [unclassified Leptospira]EMJ99489.1 PF04237 family protein [Leptospira sp. B5-022]MCR1792276.1 MmcQ/YjbR family DNA-binding protein [Leptospira sp. id769339]